MKNLETLENLIKQERFSFINDFEVHPLKDDTRFKLVSDKYWFTAGGYHAYLHEWYFEVKDGKVGYTLSERQRIQVKTEYGYKIEPGEMIYEFVVQYNSLKEAVESFVKDRAKDYLGVNEYSLDKDGRNFYPKKVLTKAQAILDEN